jgi:hypothetical protein
MAKRHEFLISLNIQRAESGCEQTRLEYCRHHGSESAERKVVFTTTLAVASVAVALAIAAIFVGYRAMTGSRQENDRLSLLSEAMNAINVNRAVVANGRGSSGRASQRG